MCRHVRGSWKGNGEDTHGRTLRRGGMAAPSWAHQQHVPLINDRSNRGPLGTLWSGSIGLTRLTVVAYDV